MCATKKGGPTILQMDENNNGGRPSNAVKAARSAKDDKKQTRLCFNRCSNSLSLALPRHAPEEDRKDPLVENSRSVKRYITYTGKTRFGRFQGDDMDAFYYGDAITQFHNVNACDSEDCDAVEE